MQQFVSEILVAVKSTEECVTDTEKYVLVKNVYKLTKYGFTKTNLVEKIDHEEETHGLSSKEKVQIAALNNEGHAVIVLRHERTH